MDTDIPVESGGEGQCFCPVDLLASALAGCSLLTMGEMAKHRGKSIDGTTFELEYEEEPNPERIAKITLKISFPDSVEADDRKKYVSAVRACPVHNSLSKEMTINVESN